VAPPLERAANGASPVRSRILLAEFLIEPLRLFGAAWRRSKLDAAAVSRQFSCSLPASALS